MDMRYTEGQTGEVAQAVLEGITLAERGAAVIALSGDLGAGKTTLAAAIAKALGVNGPVVSPTFVIAKFYPLAHDRYDRLVHVDAYRIEKLDELAPLRWNELIDDKKTLMIIEWPERIEGALPPWALRFNLTHHDSEPASPHDSSGAGWRHITSL